MKIINLVIFFASKNWTPLSKSAFCFTFSCYYGQFLQSTSINLSELVNLKLNLAQNKPTGVVLSDLSAAFDLIDNQQLSGKLFSQLGLSSCVHNWFCSYISNRSQSVEILDSLSNQCDLKILLLSNTWLCMYTPFSAKISGYHCCIGSCLIPCWNDITT